MFIAAKVETSYPALHGIKTTDKEKYPFQQPLPIFDSI